MRRTGHRASPAERGLARRLGVRLRPPRAAVRWFPAPAVKTIIQAGAPMWAAEAFNRLRAANGGKLDGFFDVFAWRDPGEVRFDEAKTSGDSPRESQRKFVKLALDLGHRLEQFTIIKVPTTS